MEMPAFRKESWHLAFGSKYRIRNTDLMQYFPCPNALLRSFPQNMGWNSLLQDLRDVFEKFLWQQNLAEKSSDAFSPGEITAGPAQRRKILFNKRRFCSIRAILGMSVAQALNRPHFEPNGSSTAAISKTFSEEIILHFLNGRKQNQAFDGEVISSCVALQKPVPRHPYNLILQSDTHAAIQAIGPYETPFYKNILEC
ncbi:hypothetical protein CEXT_363091 [Caerostris extrusa]|uniref:Uncharacterized protein n=1 Tax=Caerostris extrusa TaxID=172846 RepID=A0AAV4SZM4_CAEEX|nr:hypothetical protein CEXT_363091 [Caerostris extrusa]